MPIEGIDIEDDLLRNPNSFIPTGRSRKLPQLPDFETYATVKKVYKDLTADIVLGEAADVRGPLYKKVQIKLYLGDKTAYGELKLPQEGDLVLVKFTKNRTLPYIDRVVYIGGGPQSFKSFASKVLSYLSSVKDWIWYHMSGTKWKVKQEGDFEYISASGVTIKITGTVVTIEGASAIEFGDVVQKLVTEAFQTLYNNHIHPSATGPTGVPTVLMSSAQLTSKVKAE